MAVDQALSPAVEQAVEKIVKEKIAAYGSEMDRKIDLALRKIALEGTARAQLGERRLLVEKAVSNALSDVPHLISVAYVPLGEDYWPLFVTHDSDEPAELTIDLIDKIVDLAKLPSVPMMDLQLIHTSRNTCIPSDATVIFAKK